MIIFGLKKISGPRLCLTFFFSCFFLNYSFANEESLLTYKKNEKKSGNKAESMKESEKNSQKNNYEKVIEIKHNDSFENFNDNEITIADSAGVIIFDNAKKISNILKAGD